MQLVIVDTAQIQSYVFGSNRLRENVGGSHLVAMATREWALEAAREAAPKNNIKTRSDELDPSVQIDSDPNVQAEVVYTGGGNFVALFRDENDEAGKFIRRLSEKVLTDAPGLQLAITQESFDWDNGALADKMKDTFRKLAQEKRSRTLSAPLLGLGVSVMCQSTALPAVEMVKGIGEEPDRPASAEIVAKLKVATKTGPRPSEADERLHRITPLEDYDYPAQFEHLGGTKGEHSYIAVVHADGDGMGSRITKIGEKYPKQKENRDFINAIREFSIAVEKAAQAALQVTLDKLTARIERDNGRKVMVHRNEGRVLARIELCWDDKGHKWRLPFRPIVFGGDDLTFVCDGRLGLSLATEYMRQFTDKTKDLPDKRGSLTASAGIAIVKSHYPFARAYSGTGNRGNPLLF